jgi:hypothetical protein
MEHLVLKVLEFDLSVPTAHLFVNKMCQMVPTEDKVGNMVLAPGGKVGIKNPTQKNPPKKPTKNVFFFGFFGFFWVFYFL